MSIRYDRDDRSGATAMAPWGHREDGQTGFLPAATIIEQPPVPTPAESMAAFPTDRPRTEYPDPDNSWGLEPRMGVIDNADSGRSLPSAPLLPPAPSVTRLSRPRLTRRGSGQELRGAGGGVGRACVLRRRGRRQRRGGAHAAIRSHHQLPIAHSESYAPLRSPRAIPQALPDSDVAALPGPVLRSGPYRAPLGPHTTAMFSVELHTPVPTPFATCSDLAMA